MNAELQELSPLHVVTLASVAPQPWRNGGGTTQELLTWPPAGPWALRVSVAQIDRDGPFSAFPGVARSFVVLQGNGVRLTWPGRSRDLKPGDAPFAFDGGEPPGCALLAGATLDFNLMVRSDVGAGNLQVAGAHQTWRSTAPWRAVYVAEAAQLQRGSQPPQALAANSLCWCAAAAGESWTMHGAARAWWVEFVPHEYKDTPR